MSRKITPLEAAQLNNDCRESFLIRRFGYSQYGCSNVNTSDKVSGKTHGDCNGNYSNGEKYCINMHDTYAIKVVEDAVNDMPIYLQFPDMYFLFAKIFFVFTLVMLFLVLNNVNSNSPIFATSCLPVLSSILAITAILTIGNFIAFIGTLKKYRSTMCQCAREICEYHYEKKKENAERNEIKNIESNRIWLDVCPNCGSVRNPLNSHCTKCGSQMWREN